MKLLRPMRITALIFNPILVLTVMALSVLGCSDKKSPRQVSDKVILLKGDPIEMVKGTSLNHQASLPSSFFENLGTVFLENFLVEELADDRSSEEFIADQMNTESKGEKNQVRWVRSPHTLRLEGDQLTLEFSPEDSGYALRKIVYSERSYSIGAEASANTFQLLHQSLKKDGSAASILVYFGPQGARRLLVFSFMRIAEKSLVEMVSEKFLYLLGPGKKNFWKDSKNIPLLACGPLAKSHQDKVSTAIGLWENASQGAVKIRHLFSRDCPPFSDLNSHTLTFIDSFVERPEPGEVLAGGTVTTIDPTRGTILDSDIFIYKKEFEDAYLATKGKNLAFEQMESDSEMRTMIQSTLTHELGHFLGLHHQPDPAVKSVMSYDPSITTPQSYDAEAVKTLYRKN